MNPTDLCNAGIDVLWRGVATTLFDVLQKAKHKIKTGYRVSSPVYGDEETAISGIGQGNGLGPALYQLHHLQDV